MSGERGRGGEREKVMGREGESERKKERKSVTQDVEEYKQLKTYLSK